MQKKYFIFALSLMLALGVSTKTHALTISPVKVEVAGDPGQTLRGEMELLNEQADSKTFYSSFENFEPSGDAGSPRFVGGEDGLATWLHTESVKTIAANEKIKIPYTITIPADAEPGGYFSAIFWGEQNPKNNEAGTVTIGGKLGVLILLRVNGDIVEQAGISDFSAGDKQRFFIATPIDFVYRFANTGADRVVPLGDIVIKNIFGRTVATISANHNEGNVLPNSTRKFTSTWSDGEAASGGFFTQVAYQFKHFHLGLYTAHLQVKWGTTHKEENSTLHIFLFPWQLFLVGLSLLIVARFGLIRYNAWIISRNK